MNKKIAFGLVLGLVLCAGNAFAHETTNYEYVNHPVVKNGVGLGSVVAVVASWTRNRSLLWGIFHGVCGWLYVGYFQITRKPEERRF